MIHNVKSSLSLDHDLSYQNKEKLNRCGKRRNLLILESLMTVATTNDKSR